MMLKDYHTIAVLQTAFLGDIALTLPLISTIKLNNPNCKLIFITHPAGANIAKLSSDIEDIIIYDKRNENKGYRGIINIANKLKEFKIDLIISPHKSLRSTLISYLSNANISIGFDNASASFLYKKKVRYQFHLHEIHRVLQLLNPFKDIEKKCEYLKNVNIRFSDDTKDTVDNLLKKNTPIAIAPGSVWNTKKWIPKHFNELILLLEGRGEEIVVIGSKEDSDLAEYITKDSNANNLAGKLSIQESIYLLSKCKFLVSNDSAPIHFAGLVDCRVISIFGPTSPIFGFAPINYGDIVIQREELQCKPCRIHGSKKCPIGTHECMKKIKASDVFEKSLELL